LTLASDFTVAAWVAPEGTGWQAILTQRAMTLDPQLGLYIDANYHAYVEVALNGTLHSLSGSIALPQGQWSHVAATYDGAVLSLLVNGQLDEARAIQGTLAPSTHLLQIGRDWGPNAFQGRIDEVRIYSAALSVDDIAGVMTMPLDAAPPLSVLQTSPVSGVTGVTTTPITAAFNLPLDPATVVTTAVTLRDQKKKAVAFAISYDDERRTITITPASALAAATTYTVTLRSGADGVAALDGSRLTQDTVWSFRTAAANALVAAWNFSEGAGPTAADTTGNGNTGTLGGDAGWVRKGKTGKAAHCSASTAASTWPPPTA
jgi:hypothetical protein